MVEFNNGYYIINDKILSFSEAQALASFIREQEWRDMIEGAIDDNEDSIDFGEISKEKFIELCLESMNEDLENLSLPEPNYDEIVIGEAEDNGMLKEEESKC